MLSINNWNPARPSKAIQAFLDRPRVDARIEDRARRILQGVRKGGDRVVRRYIKQFDGATLTALKVSKAETAAATETVDAAFRKAAALTRRRVTTFCRAGMRKDWSIPTPGAGRVGEQFSPIDRVGVYIPGGTAPLVSTCLMTVTLAKLAGVREIVACTPPAADGGVNPYLNYTLAYAGATEIYKIGGIPAIGAMAYGTETIDPVQKIVGPGGAYVTAAKKCVYGDVALDLVAGPSEVAILADSRANARYAAADLLAQAEHGTGAEKALFITTSKRLAAAVAREVGRQINNLDRRRMIAKVLKRGAMIVVVKNLDEGMALCNRFAPEHLELMVQSPRRWLRRVRNAGAVFTGDWSPEVAGDFVAGPSHVLPTGGAAAMFSGLTIDDFRKRTSVISFTRRDLKNTLSAIESFGRVEGLDAHARSARIRFE
jgi:histidinol dehydrogenase